MANIMTSEEIAALLRHLGREAALAFSSRAALRVLPLLRPLLDYHRQENDAIGSTVTLAAWRAACASWLAAALPTNGAEAAAARFVFEAEESLAGDDAFLFSPDLFAASAALHAAWNTGFAAAPAGDPLAPTAFEAATSAAVVDAVSAIAAAATAIGEEPENAAASVQLAAGSDLAVLQRDGVAALLRRPLWPHAAPAWLSRMWEEMKSDLRARDVDWSVWTEWHDARLNGAPPETAELELTRVALEPEIWARGADAANAEIARHRTSLLGN